LLMDTNRRPVNQGGAKPTVSGGIIIFRRTPEGVKFLLLYRGRDYWEFPKGKLGDAERSWQAAYREVKEETGLRPSELRLVSNFKAFQKFFYYRGSEKINRVIILYLAETKQQKIVISDEHDGYGWFKLAEARKVLSKHKDSIKIVQRAYDYLSKSKLQNGNGNGDSTKNTA
jgi:8-oxo-dGTP pyrophosphatase MutT (NUDIX family)